ncbi:7-cyano-7-deazaguanine synthase QueC [Elusimicrobiota bacterium]
MKCSKSYNRKAVILLSGGLDSATCLAIAKHMGFAAHALTFGYGQVHKTEILHAKRIAKSFKVKNHLVVKLDLKNISKSSLTGKTNIPKNRKLIGNNIPSTYVPARNTIFLSIALGLAESISAQNIFIGANAVDFSGYPDCRPEFINQFAKLANIATKAGVGGKRFKIYAPLVNMTKAEIIKTGIKLGVDYSLTHTCYCPTRNSKPCGECDACKLRAKGFAQAGLSDPATSS